MFFITIKQLLDRYKHVPRTYRPDRKKIPINIITKDHIDEWNEIVDCIEGLDLHKLEFNKSGSIKTAMDKPRFPGYGKHYDAKYNVTNMYAILIEGMFCWTMTNYSSENLAIGETGDKIKPVDEYEEMLRIIKDSGFDLKTVRSSYKDGLNIKSEIEAQLVDAYYCGIEIEHAHHIDYNSSYIYGMVEAYPELWKPFNALYEKRLEFKGLSKEEGDEYDIKQNRIKNMFTHFSGACRSSKYPFYCHYVKLGKAAVNNNNKRVLELAKKLEDSGKRILAYNTDGIWYAGDQYHDDDEGPHLGNWKHDYTNCTIRFKSAGAYEFIDNNNKLHVVVRGLPKEKSKGFKWGDIFKSSIVKTRIVIGSDCRAKEIQVDDDET